MLDPQRCRGVEDIGRRDLAARGLPQRRGSGLVRDLDIEWNDYIARSGTVTDFEIDWSVLNERPPDEELFIEAWDLS